MSASKERARASELIGATPTPPVRAISLPVHHCLASWARRAPGEAPPIVLVACSGGADSMALAVSAIDSAYRLGLPVHSVTVDHGLREGSAEEAEAVASYLEDVGACAHVLGPRSFDVLAPHSLNPPVWEDEGVAAPLSPAVDVAQGPEGDARALRYGAIRYLAGQLHAAAGGVSPVLVLAGHTMDDQAETVLLRLARGSGVGSLKAMAAVVPFPLTHTADMVDGEHSRTHAPAHPPQAMLLRPLLEVRRAQTVAFCQALGCPVVEDPTNALDGPWRSADGSPLRRSAIRHRVLPAAREALGMDPVPALARTAQLSRDDDQALDVYADRAFRSALRSFSPQDEGGGLVLDIAAVADLPRGVRRRVIHRACLQAGGAAGSLSAEHLMRVDELISHWHGQGPLSIPRLRVVRRKDASGQPIMVFTSAPTVGE